ncbi:CE1759 family FMN reductase [Jonesia quinghaiensis]|uniref:CE1759 family FMN reductase n=1 Tax=Jonesia quinghaiensis TaxID=262806 RepID=UPI00041ABCB3|nr:CE1759 family FMN reductase [Jonesia quinghaiensis]
MTHVLLLSGGLSTPSSTRLLAERIAENVASLGETEAVHYEIHELRDSAHAVVDHLLTGFAPSALAEVHEKIRSADALVFVTPVYSQSIAGLAKSFLDTIDPQWLEGKPVLLAATGGTERHQLALDYAVRPIFTYAKAAVVATGIYAATNDWGDPRSAAALTARIGRATRELAGSMLESGGNGSGESSRTTPTTKAGEGGDFSSPDFASLLRAQGIEP